MFTNPETLQSISELAVALVSLIFTVVIPIVAARIYQFTGIKIEEKHMKALHEAINSWVGDAILKGVTEANEAAMADLVAYLNRSVPDAMKFFNPSLKVLATIAGKFIHQKLFSSR